MKAVMQKEIEEEQDGLVNSFFPLFLFLSRSLLFSGASSCSFKRLAFSILTFSQLGLGRNCLSLTLQMIYNQHNSTLPACQQAVRRYKPMQLLEFPRGCLFKKYLVSLLPNFRDCI